MPPAFDFPNTPSVGDLFQDSTSGAVYKWNGYAWVGGVTGIGLQTIKETRYLVAGSFTHTRDPKSNGFADVFLTGGCGGSQGWTGVASTYFVSGSGGSGAVTIKWKYALSPSCPVVVGAGYIGGTAGAGTSSGPSSFDTVLTAANGGSGTVTSTNSTTASAAGPAGVGGAPGVTGDENYGGSRGNPGIIMATGIWAFLGGVTVMRDITRRGATGLGGSGATNVTGANGDPGAVVVREYLNP